MFKFLIFLPKLYDFEHFYTDDCLTLIYITKKIIIINCWNPGQPCGSSGCVNSFCCFGFCSACCSDTQCPTNDICIVQDPATLPGLSYSTCFPKNLLPINSRCWRNEMCNSTVCQGGYQFQKSTGYTVTPGVCVPTPGNFLRWCIC